MTRISPPASRRPRARRQRGIALLEALIAVLLLAIGLLGTIGLQARAYSALSDAGMRAEATMATEKLLGMMSNDQANLAKYALAAGDTPSDEISAWVTDTKARIPGATIEVAVDTKRVNTGASVDITIRWTRKAGEQENVAHVTSYIATSA